MSSRIVIVFFLGLLLWSCNQEQNSLESYYFPDAPKGIVYKYDFSGGLLPEYWYIKQVNDSQKIITVYNNQLEQQQLSRELKVGGGYIQESLKLFLRSSKDSLEIIKPEIIEPTLYPFFPKDSLDVFLYQIRWNESQGIEKHIYRNRRFMGFDSLQLFDSKVEVAKFLTIDQIEDKREGSLTIEMKNFEYYAKPWGLIKKEQYYQGELFRSMHLIDTMSMDDLSMQYKHQIN